ncbi:ABC transporter permease [uncultured Rummeliibacillus sp.]|uniref:ABC transporter permease n=1 Tax=uncultured Rummeliibacillus sp. TaxID=762292 RepID=UPI00260E447C|nr:ABC transporter permease subunit [uncultured Rummeliibacillus sp.]
MLAIATKEFVEMMKSFKSLFIIALFVLSSYFMSSFVSKNVVSIGTDTNNYVSVTRILILLFGFLFVLMLSHDLISRETSTKTIRFLITKTSRTSIIVGKFLGVAAFWLFSLGISITIVSFFAKDFLWFTFLQLYSFLIFAIGLCLLISTLAKTTGMSMLLGLAVSFIAPIVGFWSMFSEKTWLKPFKLLLPYQYQIKENGLVLIPLIIGLLFICISIWHFKRGDY